MEMTNCTHEDALNYIHSNIVVTEAGCHEWQGPRTKGGYGQVGKEAIYQRYGIRGAHRLAVHLIKGYNFTSRDEQVMHGCHNRCCVNTDHLTVGTAKQNMADAVARNPDMSRGVMNGRALLTEDEVRSIKAMIEYGYRNCYIAERFPVAHRRTISNIRTGNTWAHVTI
jgi:hypothetical protein